MTGFEAGVYEEGRADCGGGSDYVYGAVASVDTAEFVEYAAAACVVDKREGLG